LPVATVIARMRTAVAAVVVAALAAPATLVA
jgi:hypothetical protein